MCPVLVPFRVRCGSGTGSLEEVVVPAESEISQDSLTAQGVSVEDGSPKEVIPYGVKREDRHPPEHRDTGPQAILRRSRRLLQAVAAAFRTRECGSEIMQEVHSENSGSSIEAKYRALLEQIPAIVFMAYVDRGTSEVYVSPEIEAALGYPREEWLEDPARLMTVFTPTTSSAGAMETAEMFVSGKPLRSSYRVIAQNGRVVWFRCDARMVRRPDGQPWFIHGVAFEITDLKETERALQQERNFASGIVDTVGRPDHGSG